ncbi:phage major tail protein, TP901-1 family [Bacillus sp. sid0103]|uniref:phage major tail protein, TP901-1 family n=1 Tax=Bacillus sp. sid0103 TaxID=2856337 RepID=UPI001C45A814|nr:phage major tail protein, TP901-1 family [Bacillus sp. sid0103]MBV7509626.1 phage major tail protein, TP901-1 family [Bacillus sp. sid0103]
MAKLAGMKVLLKIKNPSTGVTLAGQKNATLNRSAETIDATSKDTAGFWKESIQGFKEWSIDADGCFVESDVAYDYLETKFLNSENVDVELVFPSGKKYSGSVTITDFSLEFPYDDLVTYSVSLQGSGALTLVPGA